MSDDANRIQSELTLRGLRVFVALEETGSIAGAAQRLGGSSSGVSQHITALEAAIGAKLFDRRAKPVTLTPAGQVLRAHAHRILNVVSEAQAELAEISMTSLPQLNLAIIDDLDASLTPVLVSALQARFRKCFVHAFSGRSDQIIERLNAREADIGVTALLPADTTTFQSAQILREAFILVTAKGAIGPGSDPREALTRLPFVQYSETMPLGQKVAQHLKRVKLNVPRRFAFEATRSVLAMVVQTGGWTLTTPLNLLDAERFIPMLDILPLPFAGETRHVHLVARAEELGHLPEALARDCRRILRDVLIPRFVAIAPGFETAIEVAEDEA
ncbi:LysR family transcriptional regulator [Fuscovulum ytuae]|uniref:LysR family transcriptional regulator n=1 Tax=Fuscovulum ytuae TaxID=3042299 RepID=A0ABY8Q4P8_9RHOB|nr:LysR family transcriptional regulator [Fuscovulum sp. YMD61]WGV15592.1 LysR family transcriptional regulator [Fuscovulum sp. YMD61]